MRINPGKIKKTESYFDMTMDSYDGVEICDLVGIYIITCLTRRAIADFIETMVWLFYIMSMGNKKTVHAKAPSKYLKMPDLALS